MFTHIYKIIWVLCYKSILKLLQYTYKQKPKAPTDPKTPGFVSPGFRNKQDLDDHNPRAGTTQEFQFNQFHAFYPSFLPLSWKNRQQQNPAPIYTRINNSFWWKATCSPHTVKSISKFQLSLSQHRWTHQAHRHWLCFQHSLCVAETQSLMAEAASIRAVLLRDHDINQQSSSHKNSSDSLLAQLNCNLLKHTGTLAFGDHSPPLADHILRSD